MNGVDSYHVQYWYRYYILEIIIIIVMSFSRYTYVMVNWHCRDSYSPLSQHFPKSTD